jgi:hypothetical protein
MTENVDVLVLIQEGKDPVFITSSTVLVGKDLKNLLVAKGVLHRKADTGDIDEPIGGFLKDAAITLEAFYFSDSGPVLMQFDLETAAKDETGNEVGVVAALTGDSDLEQLFVPTGASARVLCCTKDSFETLRRYAAEVSAKRTNDY